MNKLLDFGFDSIDLWRSEEMQLMQLIIPAESAHSTITALGEVGLLEFRDLNEEKSAFQRSYASQVKRCEEMARRLRYFHEQVEKAGMVSPLLTPLSQKTYELDELETKLEDLEKEVIQMNSNGSTLQRTFAEFTELALVLEKAGAFFEKAKRAAGRGAFESSSTENQDAPLLESQEKVSRVGFVAGTVLQEKVPAFERLLFRATRGNVFLQQTSIGKVTDPATNELAEKSVFVIFFAGERSRTKVMKICEAFGANRYPFPEDAAKQGPMLSEINGRIRELSSTIEAGQKQKQALLGEVATNLHDWGTMVRKQKAVYHTLNKLNIDVTSKVLIAEAWMPTFATQAVQEALRSSAAMSSTQLNAVMQPLPCEDQPPTYYQTNKFTSSFQAIVESYGVAKYREVNPTVLTIVTFPFLFAVMFGDVGHAILMLAFAGFMLFHEAKLMKQDLGDMIGLLFGGRYVILLMALFSIYTGLIYNEFFSMPMQIFGPSKWLCALPTGELAHVADLRDCGHHGGMPTWMPEATPYPLGVDPVWHGRKTELPYLNSLKMKMSILLGVVHMDMGILMSLFNNLHYKDTLSTLCEFIPQIIFLNSLFGYLSILIVTKWVTGSFADLYHVMIYMFLSPGSMDAQGQVFAGQGKLQLFLVLIAFFSVPIMLLPKPLILKSRHEALMKAKGAEIQLASSSSSYGAAHTDEESLLHGATSSTPVVHKKKKAGGGHGHGHGEFEFGEVLVHQMIHTIEFVLGAVSNTASYLRLWALSLAHSQLSSVFYDRVLMMTISMNNVFFMFIGFFMFACATLGVLMVMESLSAFLHALRLHWVEYMNKFYKGDGYSFAPFSFELLAQEEAASA